MLQYYLRAEGLALSWVGTGRLIFSLNYTDADFEAVADRFVAAARAMQRDGFWWSSPGAHQQVDQAPGAPGDARAPLESFGPLTLTLSPQTGRGDQKRVEVRVS